jgi:hypothetical protein
MRMRYFFDSIQGDNWRCDYPPGTDPLLEEWQQGNFSTHPRWTDPEFRRRVARALAAIERGAAQNRLKRQAAKMVTQ